LQQAARQGDSEAQFWLGTGYEEGSFGRVDYKEALKWIQKSAKQGHPDAQTALGEMWEEGEGVRQDYGNAVQWYRKAGEHFPDLGGAGQGRNKLGILYEQGLGVPVDYVQAYKWVSLGHGDVSYAKAHLTPARILHAEGMVNEWKSRHPWP
jgi:uncharacterized protein